MDHPTDNLIRARFLERDAIDTDEAGILHGHFSVFDSWYEVNSAWEGRFVERVAPGAFTDTIARDADRVRVLYDHGADPTVGNKPLGKIRSLTEDDTGAAYEVQLFTDASYVADLMPALRAGELGASFRFRVARESWAEPKKATAHNPHELPERTIEAVDLYEFGPVTFPASMAATAGVRSMSDTFIEKLLSDPRFVARFTDRVGVTVVDKILAGLPDDVRDGITASEPADGGDEAPDTGTPVSIVRARAFALGALR